MYFIKGSFAFFLWSVNTLLAFCFILPIAIVKWLMPLKSIETFCSQLLANIGFIWVGVNNLIIEITQNIEWSVHLPEGLSTQSSYLILSNHQSWVDIVILQKIFWNKVPFLRFFIKKELFWVPFLGIAWWALDFPFMSRYSKQYLEKHPEKRGKDIETTRRSCERFKQLSTAILIFPEGTRFTEKKHKDLKSTYKNLLPPKTGGIATVLSVMGEQFTAALDVNICYQDNKSPKNFLSLFLGRIKKIDVHVEAYPIPKELLDSHSDQKRKYPAIKSWVKDIWQKKVIYDSDS